MVYFIRRARNRLLGGVVLLAVLAAIGYGLLHATAEPYQAKASRSLTFSLPVDYLRAVAAFARPDAEERFVELSGGGEVVGSKWDKVQVHVPDAGVDEQRGVLSRLIGAVTSGMVDMRGTITVRPFDPRMQGRELTFIKTVRAELGQMHMGSKLAEPVGLLRQHEMMIVMRRAEGGTDVSIDLTMAIEYDIPPLPFARQLVDDGLDDAAQDELERTRAAIEEMLEVKSGE